MVVCGFLDVLFLVGVLLFITMIDKVGLRNWNLQIKDINVPIDPPFGCEISAPKNQKTHQKQTQKAEIWHPWWV